MASKAYTISVPQDLMQTVDSLASREHRTRSGLIQEALRRYVEPPQVIVGTPWFRELYDLYAPVREEFAAMGMTEEEIGRMVDEEIAAYREEKRAKRSG